jgi:hypothetical protein
MNGFSQCGGGRRVVDGRLQRGHAAPVPGRAVTIDAPQVAVWPGLVQVIGERVEGMHRNRGVDSGYAATRRTVSAGWRRRSAR